MQYTNFRNIASIHLHPLILESLGLNHLIGTIILDSVSFDLYVKDAFFICKFSEMLIFRVDKLKIVADSETNLDEKIIKNKKYLEDLFEDFENLYFCLSLSFEEKCLFYGNFNKKNFKIEKTSESNKKTELESKNSNNETYNIEINEFVINHKILNRKNLKKNTKNTKLLFGTVNCKTDSNLNANLITISRRSHLSLGTRFFNRGISLPSLFPTNCAETEVLVLEGDLIHSYLQLRGSIPFIWRQRIGVAYNPEIEIGGSNIDINKITDNNKELDLEIFKKLDLNKTYELDQKNIFINFLIKLLNFILNIFSLKKNDIFLGFNRKNSTKIEINQKIFQNYDKYLSKKYGKILYLNLIKNYKEEKELYEEYLKIFKHSKNKNNVNFLCYDIKKLKDSVPLFIEKVIKSKAYFINNNSQNLIYKNKDEFFEYQFNKINTKDYSTFKKLNFQLEILRKQSQIIRTNCVDSSDRTTAAQIQFAVNFYDSVINKGNNSKKVEKLILDSGKLLSIQYTGTECLLYSFTRDRYDLIGDFIKSIKRYFINRYLIAKRQDSYDYLSGRYLEVKSNYNNNGEYRNIILRFFVFGWILDILKFKYPCFC